MPKVVLIVGLAIAAWVLTAAAIAAAAPYIAAFVLVIGGAMLFSKGSS